MSRQKLRSAGADWHDRRSHNVGHEAKFRPPAVELLRAANREFHQMRRTRQDFFPLCSDTLCDHRQSNQIQLMLCLHPHPCGIVGGTQFSLWTAINSQLFAICEFRSNEPPTPTAPTRLPQNNSDPESVPIRAISTRNPREKSVNSPEPRT